MKAIQEHIDLFGYRKGAIFSKKRKYRYVLWREWDASLPKLMYIGLNPSTANESSNDNTIKRVIKISKFNGYGGLYMLNLFAFISTDPDNLLTCKNPVGNNDRYLIQYSKLADRVIFCWGNFNVAVGRDQVIKEMFPDGFCIGVNNNLSPVHPLLQKGSSPFHSYRLLAEKFQNEKPAKIVKRKTGAMGSESSLKLSPLL